MTGLFFAGLGLLFVAVILGFALFGKTIESAVDG